MSNENTEFTVEDGKLVADDEEKVDFEENLTFEGESDA